MSGEKVSQEDDFETSRQDIIEQIIRDPLFDGICERVETLVKPYEDLDHLNSSVTELVHNTNIAQQKGREEQKRREERKGKISRRSKNIRVMSCIFLL